MLPDPITVPQALSNMGVDSGTPMGSSDFIQTLRPTLEGCSAVESQHQQTLRSTLTLSGVGLHSGEVAQVQLCPAPPDAGRYFVRVDLPSAPRIPAQVKQVSQTVLSTELAQGDAAVRTVEHLLAALAGLGIDNVRIEINGPEVPLLDGSSLEWVQNIVDVGWVSQSVPRSQRSLKAPEIVQQDEAFVVALPSSKIQLSYGIDFPDTIIGCQWHSTHLSDFATEISPARTFGLASDVEMLQNRGLIKGGSLENALVCTQEGWLNPPLRYTNEPVRHKLLDLIGDLSLLGALPRVHVVAYKASHALHLQLARRLLQSTTLTQA
ncbi:UDP-3-O-acyl-N-acetylglucosamine deacetylase [Acaryochloris thomasi RCC1774]|uniref:UDP-3-O-acyl-N-acetylglucosamine deacetylase n=1 Tax=Acaryochloris thomasi RCC1774 TaxID=1764569 RepID=A0A2W1JNQ0_9CYAN|nr:UDP-3-O-acyl-N-acetylglucosamine deacetylase [Acaryochloris thomasi]PZD71774.1 UDP-3-O-acyl-N-acetylglucosamine deacetylase [Acaryochloris thomasi RCC1774]